jgi:large subunit ribosomal protein L25
MLAMNAVKTFRQKEIRAPTMRVFAPYRAPIPKPAPSTKPSSTLGESTLAPTSEAHGQPNPFLPRFNTKTGRWAPAKYSLRQQAELIKKAKVSNTLHLLPPGPKLAASDIKQHLRNAGKPLKFLNGQPWAKKDAVVWEGEPKPKVVGADIGNRLYAGKKRMFKGHKWERTLDKRVRRRKMLLSDMKKRIVRYKGYYHRRQSHPLKPAKVSKSAKLPF